MHIGILDAVDPDRNGIRWNGDPTSRPTDAFVAFLQTADPTLTVQPYFLTIGELPATLDECDAYLITGSPSNVYDPDPWIQDLGDFLRAAYGAGKTLVGICFGHQILAHALGGHAGLSEKGWGLGLDTFTVTASKPWMDGVTAGQACSLYFAHHDQVMELPPGAELLGSSEFCPNAMFAIGDQVLGVQGHPEFSRAVMADVLGLVAESVGPERIARATASLESGQAQGALLARWIVAFLKQT